MTLTKTELQLVQLLNQTIADKGARMFPMLALQNMEAEMQELVAYIRENNPTERQVFWKTAELTGNQDLMEMMQSCYAPQAE